MSSSMDKAGRNDLLASLGNIEYDRAVQSGRQVPQLEVKNMLSRTPPFSRFLLTIAAVFLTGNAFAVCFQTSPDDTRGLKPREYAERLQNQIAQKRPRSKRPKPRAKARYVALTNDNTPVVEGTDVGITLWRLRPALKTDAKVVQEQTRIAVRKKGQSEDKMLMMTPTRAESETVFSDGDLLKFTVESPFEAHIYILNREQYEDGTMSDPYLIFPAREDVGINDKGSPGRLLFLPSVKDDDKFELKRLSDLNPKDSNNAEKAAEIFTLIVSKQPIKELPPLEKGDEPRKIDKQQFESWQSEWGGRMLIFEKQGGAGTTITRVEKQAGAKGGEVLAGDDPKPQTVYHVERKAANTLLFDLSIKIRK